MRDRKAWLVSFGLAIFTSHIPSAVSIELKEPDRWKDAVQRFEAADAASPPPRSAIVFTGSSSIVFWSTLQSDMAPLTVINRGFGGSTARDLTYWLDPIVLKTKPRAVVVYEGDNDIGEAKLTAEEVVAEFKTLFARIQEHIPHVRIYVLSIKPTILRWALWPEMRRANGLMRSLCDNTDGVSYVDVATPMLNAHGQPRPDLFQADGLHMNSRGYAIWVSVLKPKLLTNERRYESEK
jgi:lysophospholipase L1-like esterase